MIPSGFKCANKLLGAPVGHVPDESEIGEILALPVYCDGQQCISLWRPTWRERISVLFFGQVWCQVWFGESSPPVCLSGMRNFIKPAEQRVSRWERFSLFCARWWHP